MVESKHKASVCWSDMYEPSQAPMPHGYGASINVWCRLLSETATENQVRAFRQSESVIEEKESFFYSLSRSLFS